MRFITSEALNIWALNAGGRACRLLAAWYVLKHHDRLVGGHGWLAWCDALDLVTEHLAVTRRTAKGYLNELEEAGWIRSWEKQDATDDACFDLASWATVLALVGQSEAHSIRYVQFPLRAFASLVTTKAAYAYGWYTQRTGITSRSTQERIFGVTGQTMRNYVEALARIGIDVHVEECYGVYPRPADGDVAEQLPDAGKRTYWHRCSKCGRSTRDYGWHVKHCQIEHPDDDPEELALCIWQLPNRYAAPFESKRKKQYGSAIRAAQNTSCALPVAGDGNVAGSELNAVGLRLYYEKEKAARRATKRNDKPCYRVTKSHMQMGSRFGVVVRFMPVF